MRSSAEPAPAVAVAVGRSDRAGGCEDRRPRIGTLA